MAKRNNLLTVEDEIAAMLNGIDGVNEIYRFPITDGLNNLNVVVPSLIIENKGFSGRDFSGSRQSLTTFWKIGVICMRQDYLSVGGVIMADIIRALVGNKHPDWMNKARLSQTPPSDQNRPEFEEDVAYFPALFEIDVII